MLLFASGVGYAVLDIVGNSVIASLPGAPTTDDPFVASYFARNESTIVLMAWIIAFGAVLLATFGVALRHRLRGLPAADVAAASGIMAAAVIVASSGVLLAAAGQRSQDQAAILWSLWNSVGLVSTLPMATMVLAVSVETRRERAGRAWIWRTGFPLAVLCLVPYIGFVNLKLFPLWIAALSVSLLRGRWRGERSMGRWVTGP